MLHIQGLQALGIDTDEGLACCAGDPEFYEEMLGAYAAEAQTGSTKLEQDYSSHDWKSYGIRVHTVKSTSRMIGAKDLSEEARQLETAAKESDPDTILSHHDAFLAAYIQLAEEIKKNIGQVSGENICETASDVF
ncbi:MAG: Hpt domain-containing protein [Blautia sp.]|nr:Hpt domain-containing protein [Blautia sp.]